MQITKEKFLAGCRVLIDNGIEPDEAQHVMQALFCVMHDAETEHLMVSDDNFPCCKNCVCLDLACVGNYSCGDIFHLPNFLEGPKESNQSAKELNLK